MNDVVVDPSLVAFYKDLHEHPELCFQEQRTSLAVAERLTALGFEVTTGVGKTGVVAILRNGDGPTALLRADLDALPVTEATGLPYASTATVTDDSARRWASATCVVTICTAHAWWAPQPCSLATAPAGRAI